MSKNPIYILLASMTVLLSFAYKEYPKVKNYNDNQLHIYFFDVGEGDSALIKSPDNHLILIDGGPSREVLYKISEVMPFWIETIDVVVISHSHADHITGVLSVFDRYNVKCILYDESDESISNTENQFRTRLEGGEYTVSDELSKLADSDCLPNAISVKGYSLRESAGKNENYESISIFLKYAGFEALFLADAEAPVQKIILDSISADIEVLKVPHHGSSDAFYSPLIKKLKPDLGIISVGENNKFGHPNEEVVEGYSKYGIKILRTDLDGDIHVTSNGDLWKVL